MLNKTILRKKGLTLVEILVVILIITLLIVALLPRVTKALDKAKETKIRTDFKNFSLAAESVLREYAGFNGVPLKDSTGLTLLTIGEKFWNQRKDVEEGVKFKIGSKEYNTAVTQSLIRAVNRYLEENYQFEDNVNSANFGRSAALDPWERAYEIYFVARNSTQEEGVNSDKIYVVCSGKTQNQYYPDFMLLCEYHNGEVRTEMAGFSDTLPKNYTVFAGKVNNKQYVLLGSLFSDKCTTSGLSDPKESPTIGQDTIFNMGATGNKVRLFIEKNDGKLISQEAVNAQ